MLIVAILNFTFRNISRLFSIGLLALSTGANNNTTTDAAEYCKIPFDSHKHIDKYKTKEYVATERNHIRDSLFCVEPSGTPTAAPNAAFGSASAVNSSPDC